MYTKLFKLQDVFNSNIEDVNGFIVYKITNKITNESYIGSTQLSILQRFTTLYFRSHKKNYDDKKNTKLYQAMIKYGIDNFEVKVIGRYKNKNIMREKEVYYIKKFNTVEKGYNHTETGTGKGNVENLKKYWKGKRNYK